MLRLAMRTLRHRAGGFVATFVGMFLCAALMVGAGGLLETTLRNAIPPERLAAAPIVVAGDQSNGPSNTFAERVRLDAALADDVAAVPGVAQAVPDVSFPATVLTDAPAGPDGPASYGRSWETAPLRPYTLTEGTEPAAGQVVLDATAQRLSGATVGSTVDVAVRGGVETFEVAGIAQPTGTATEASLFFAAADVDALSSDPGRVDAIAVLTEPGADVGAVRDAVTGAVAGRGAVVLTGDRRGHAEFLAALETDDMLLISLMLATVAFLVSLLGIAVTLTLSFQNRHREIALLRAVGATPGQLRRMVLGETLGVSLIATALAVVPGLLLGRLLFTEVKDAGIAPEPMTFHLGWIPTVVAVATALVTSVGAAILAGRRVTRTRPTEALADLAEQKTRVGWVRRILAIVCLLYAGGLVAVTLFVLTGPFVSGPATWASILVAVALLLLGPDVARLMTAIVGPLVRATGGLSGRLAVLNAQARPAQVAAVVTPILLLTTIATGTLYTASTENSSIGAYTEGIAGGVILLSGPDGFAPDALDEVRAQPDVAAASEFVTSNGFVTEPADPWAGMQGVGGWQLKGFSGDAAADIAGAKVAAGSLAGLEGDTVALNTRHAADLGVGVGDSITMRLGDGAELPLQVVATYDEEESFESITLPARLLAEHTTIGLPTHIVATPAPGTSEAQLEESLAGIAGRIPGTQVVDRATLDAAFENYVDAFATINYLFVAILVGFIAISVINTLALAIGRRRREFGLQRLTGATRGQVLGMTALEGTLVAIIGIVLGSLIVPVTLVPFSLARIGRPIPIGPWWMYPAVVVGGFVLVVGATFLATLRATRSRPLEAALPEAG